MTDRSEGGGLPVGSPLDAGTAWGVRQDRLWRALSHHLNGRANTLSGLVEVLEQEGASPEITGHLRAEVDRVSRVAGLVRGAVGPAGSPEILVLSTLASDALALGGLEEGTARLARDELEVEADAAVRTDPVHLSRLLILLRARLRARCPRGSLDARVASADGLALLELRGETTDADGQADGSERGEEEEVAWEELVAAARGIPGVAGLERDEAGGVLRYRLSLRPLE